MMRKSLIILLASVATFSCQRREPLPDIGEKDVMVQASFDGAAMSAPQTKATSTTFESGDQIGLFMVDFVSGNRAPLKTEGNQVDNVCFTSNSTGLLTTNPPVRFTKDFQDTTDIYAYYPYDARMLTKDVNAYEFKIQESQVGGITASDFCMVKKGVKPTSSPVPLLFEHKLSKIELTLNVPRLYKEGMKIKGVKSLTFIGVGNGVTVNMGAGSVTNIDGSEVQELQPYVLQQGVVNDDENTPFVYQMIAPAQTYPLGSLFIRAILEFEIGKPIPFEYKVGTNLFGNYTTVAGKVHKLSFSVDPGQELTFKGSTIVDWVGGPNVDNGGLNEAISTEFSVQQQDFAPSFASANRVKVTVEDGAVYDITTGVSMSGGTCKFKFTHASGAPREYGFKIVNLEFFSGNTSLYSCKMISSQVYDSQRMNLGTLPFRGEGIMDNPYLISNAAELEAVMSVGSTKGKYFKQTASIDLAPYLAIRYKAGSVPAGGDGSTLAFEANTDRINPKLGSDTGWDASSFSGSYDGGRYTIGGVIINRPSDGLQGLFGGSSSSASFVSIVVKDSYIYGRGNVGGVVGTCSGNLIDCHMINGVIKSTANSADASAIGGVVGGAYKNGVINCSNGATIFVNTSGINVGGVAGVVVGFSSGLYNFGKVTVVNSGKQVGGVIGSLNSALSSSYNRANISALDATTSGAVLGFVDVVSTATNCYWLSTATYTNCGPNGYGTSTAASQVTNFAAMTAADMQNTNRNDPASLLYKLNKGPVQWVMAPAGHWNAGWPIPNPNSYTVAFYDGATVAKEGATVSVEVIVPAGTSWTATSADTAVATVTSETASGSSRGIVTVEVKANAGAARTAVIKIVSTKGSSDAKILQAAGV